MKALSSSMLALVLAALPIVCSPAGTDKSLQALDGTVTYGASATPTTKLAKNAIATLSDNDYAVTGAGNSLATITLPDSSVVKMGAQSSVQMQSFNNVSGTATAKFLVVGKVRFQVEHPAGAKANYTFQTPTGQIAVRGTVGDILATQGAGGAPAGLQVNVYSLGSIANPVQVTLINGQVFTLAAGQSLVVTAAGGALVGAVGAVSQSSFAPFTQLGAPANASSLGISTTASTTAAGAGTTAAGSTAATTAATTAAATTAGVTATAVAVGTAAVVTATTTKTTDTPTPAPTATASPTMSPSPSPQPTGTTVPITISGGQHQPGPVPAPPTGPQGAGPTAPNATGPGAPHIPGPPGPHGLNPNPNPRPSPPVH